MSRISSSSSCGLPTAPMNWPRGIDEVALPVEVVGADVGLDAHPVDRPHEVAVGQRVADLLDPPQVFGQAAARGRRDEHHLGAVQAQRACALGEVPVVADVDPDLADRGLEHRVAEVARPEVELLPEPLHVRDVGLAVLAEVRAVRVDHGRGVVVDARGLRVLLVHRHHEDHAGLLGQVLHPLRRRPVRDELGVAVVLLVLHLAEVGAVEQLLEQHHLGALLGRLVREALVLLDHRLLVAGPARLQQRASDVSRHRSPPRRMRAGGPGRVGVRMAGGGRRECEEYASRTGRRPVAQAAHRSAAARPRRTVWRQSPRGTVGDAGPRGSRHARRHG